MRFHNSITSTLFFLCFTSTLFAQGWVKKTVATNSDLHSVYFVSVDIGYTVGLFGGDL